MEIEKIKELFVCNVKMEFEEFTKAINQAELEWYKELDKNLYDCGSYGRIGKFYEYRDEIQNKIKELENGN